MSTTAAPARRRRLPPPPPPRPFVYVPDQRYRRHTGIMDALREASSKPFGADNMLGVLMLAVTVFALGLLLFGAWWIGAA